MQAALEQVRLLSRHAGNRSELPVVEQRRLLELERRWWNERPGPLARELHFHLEGPFRKVPVHAFEPAGVRPDAPWIVWFHGGGWILGSARTHASLIRGVAAATGCRVFAPDYALAPEHPFPAPVDEARETLGLLRERAAKLGLPVDRLVVGGDSSGANVGLAAALALQHDVPGAVRAGIFYYGVFDQWLDEGSALEFGDGRYGLSTERMRYYRDCYVQEQESLSDGRVDLQRADLSAAFPMYLMAAECDILRDGAARFAQRLARQSIPHRFRLCDGMAHAFMGYGRMIPSVTLIHDEAATFLEETVTASARTPPA